MFIKLISQTKLGAHIEMTAHVESMDDSVVEYSFRGRYNWFLMERVSSEGTVLRYILFTFVINTEEQGWMMRVLTEDEFIPYHNCPLFMVRQSTLQDESAFKWRETIIQIDVDRQIQQDAIAAQETMKCACRHIDKPTNGDTKEAHISMESPH